MDGTHFGVTLPQIKRTWQEARDTALEIDRLKFDSVWVCDHMYGVPNPALPIFEGWSQLAAIAAITEHAKFTDAPYQIEDNQVFAVDHIVSGAKDSVIPVAKHGGDSEQLREPADRT